MTSTECRNSDDDEQAISSDHSHTPKKRRNVILSDSEENSEEIKQQQQQQSEECGQISAGVSEKTIVALKDIDSPLAKKNVEAIIEKLDSNESSDSDFSIVKFHSDSEDNASISKNVRKVIKLARKWV